MQRNPFKLYSRHVWLRPFLYLVERVSGLRTMQKCYDRIKHKDDVPSFLEETLALNGIRHAVHGDLSHIPEEGPVVVVSNHPTGMADGLVLPWLLLKRRPDLKVLVNEFLVKIDALQSIFIGVDVLSGGAQRGNLSGLREASRHLAKGGCLLVFPAGEVSSYHWSVRRVQDPPWNRLVAQWVVKYQASTVPVFIDARNSFWFYFAGLIHPKLRTLLIPRQCSNKRGQCFGVHIGEVIPAKEIQRISGAQSITQYLRLNSDLLAPHKQVRPQDKYDVADIPVAGPIPKADLLEDIARLTEEHVMVSRGEYVVYVAKAKEIPHIMQEIGRIRELNFRQVGEGTGQAIDLDRFDETYRHLFIWHKSDEGIVGAYRFGCVDELMASEGLSGLYTHTLFDYDETFLERMGSSIEMGRSVIDLPYQRSVQPLLLLWQGISTYMARHPDYRILFGPVSISNDYSMRARQLMAVTLKTHHYDQQLSQYIKPRRAMKKMRHVWAKDAVSVLSSVQVLSRVIARMELGQGLPVLLRQYIALNGRLVSFNIDPDFGNALDGMIVVDLPSVPVQNLSRYMGADVAKQYLHYHDALPPNSA